MDFFLKVIGIMMVLEGIPWFLSPRGSKRVLQQIEKMPDSTLRVLGVILMGLGLLAVYAGTS